MNKDLKKLVEIVNVIRDTELARSAKLKAHAAELEQNMKDSHSLKRAASEMVCDAITSNQYVLYERLTEQRISLINSKRISVAAEIEVQKLKTSRAFGRAQILNKLLKDRLR